MGYESGLGHVLPAAATTTVVAVLPNTGNNLFVQLGIAVAAGMLTWAVLYGLDRARATRTR